MTAADREEYRIAEHLSRWPLLTVEEARRELGLDGGPPTVEPDRPVVGPLWVLMRPGGRPRVVRAGS